MGRISGSALRRRPNGKYWIQKSIKKPGSLREFAESHGFIHSRTKERPQGLIDLDASEKYIRSHMEGAKKKLYLEKVEAARRFESFRK
jgi:hypothetical protein